MMSNEARWRVFNAAEDVIEVGGTADEVVGALRAFRGYVLRAQQIRSVGCASSADVRSDPEIR